MVHGAGIQKQLFYTIHFVDASAERNSAYCMVSADSNTTLECALDMCD